MIARGLALAARHGRYLLVAGLVAGISLPGLAAAMRPLLEELVVLLLFLAALRIGARAALGSLRDLRSVLGVALVYQVAVPLIVLTGLTLAGQGGTPLATALVLMTAAAPVAGSPNLTVLLGGDPAPALRLLIVGTALLPLTVIPVFGLATGLGDGAAVLAAAGRLFAAIACAAGAGFALRRVAFREPGPEVIAAFDGLSALAFAVIVVGLMAPAGPTLVNAPGEFLFWLAVVMVANLGLQVLAATLLPRVGLAAARTPLSVCSGNRNIALFLVALPASVTDSILIFIGCYQVPMYLTPILMQRFYARRATD